MTVHVQGLHYTRTNRDGCPAGGGGGALPSVPAVPSAGPAAGAGAGAAPAAGDGIDEDLQARLNNLRKS